MNELDTGSFTYYETSLMFHGSLMNIMGTRFDILLLGKNKEQAEAIWYKIESGLKQLHAVLNRFDETSETSRINRDAPHQFVEVSDKMWHILNNCKYYYQKTSGLFDITLKDFSAIQLDEERKSVFFENTQTRIDFGGYGKGYALKKIKVILEESGIQHCLVDFGNSSILGMGHHPYGDAWEITIENPYNLGQLVDKIALKDKSLSISGNTPAYSGHIVSPGSGQPVEEHKIVSVIAKDPLDAEILSTAFMIANRKQREQIKKNFTIQTVKEYRL